MPDGLSRKEPSNFQKNVLGGKLEVCSLQPMTGFYRNGCCETDENDMGLHTVCAEMTTEFLEYSKSVGNDLSTPRPEFDFRGLVQGDLWCLCASRWQQAFESGKAPNVKLSSTNIATLNICSLDDLKKHAINEN
ncbi:MAG: hypothetical protein CMN37_03625 [SAR116 cluster bacterium]|nr:hypothetical protein [SAR116 cluster bacterium]